jgi:hypothetical protein
MVGDDPTTPTVSRQASNRRSVAEGARPNSAPSPIRKASPARPLVTEDGPRQGAVDRRLARAVVRRALAHPEGSAAALRHPQAAQLVEPHAREGQDGDGGEEIGVGCAEHGREVPVRQRVVRPHARAVRRAWAMAGLSVWKQRIWVRNSPDAHHVAAAAAA